MYGLGLAGADGVAHVLKLLRNELRMAMALLGCARIAELNRDVLWR